jgi:hypothetical protein
MFEQDRYFDVFVEYAKQSPEDLLIQISLRNRGPEPATLHVLPTLWFRNIWTWWPGTPRVQPLQLHTPIWASAICTVREMSLCCSRRTRPTMSGSSVRPTRLVMPKTESTTT